MGDGMRRAKGALVTALAMAAAAGCTEPARSPASSPPLSPPVSGSPLSSPAAPSPSPSPAASPPDWVGTWAVATQSGGRSFQRQTLRQIVHTSIGGDSVRLRLSNEFGTRPLTLRTVRLARSTSGSGIDPGTTTAVTFGGSGSVTVPAGEVAVSDEVAFTVPADGDVAVSLHLPAATGATTQHALAGRDNYVAAGDQAAAAGLRGAEVTKSYYFLAGLDVRNARATGAVVAFGASITDGLGSAHGANRRWPDLLADRLRASGREIGVLNAGISGNRLLADRPGWSGVKRFDRDVLRQPGVRWVIVSDNALNDLGGGSGPDRLIAGLRELIGRADAAGVGVICSTLTPYRGAGYWTSRGESGRAAVNAFVRDPGNGCDHVLDQDTATHDPAQPTRLRAADDTGDHLHPSPAGMAAIAGAVDLDWFGPPGR